MSFGVSLLCSRVVKIEVDWECEWQATKSSLVVGKKEIIDWRGSVFGVEHDFPTFRVVGQRR